MKSITIFLTGCIHPNTKEGLVISDADVQMIHIDVFPCI